MNSIKNIFKNATRYDFLTIFFFSIALLLAITDKFILENATKQLSSINEIAFVIAYIVLVIFLFVTIKMFIKIVDDLRIKQTKTLFNNIIRGLKLLFIGYYVGFLISLTNAFIIVTFNQTLSVLK